MLNYGVDYLSIVITAVVGFVVGFVWWGPLFGKKWAKLMSMSEKDMRKAKEKGLAKPMVIMAVTNLIMAYVLAVLLLVTGMSALSLACHVWFGFVASIMVGSVLWENRSWNLFWLNSIGWLVTISVMALTLSLL